MRDELGWQGNWDCIALGLEKVELGIGSSMELGTWEL